MPENYLSAIGILPNPMGAINDQLAASVGLDAKKAQTELLRAQTDEATHKAQREDAFQTDLQGALSDPSASNISGLIMKYPEFADHLKQGWDVKDKAAQQSDLTQLGEIYSAAASGNWDLASKLSHARHDADKAAGKADDADGQIIDAIDSGDEKQRKAVLGLVGSQLAAVTGPEHFGSVYGALKGGYTLDAGAARYDDNGNLVAHSPFIKDGEDNIRLWTDGSGAPPPASSGSPDAPAASGGFDNAVATVLSNEGGYNPKDMNGAPVNFGINAKANADELRKLGVSNIKNLTRDQAVQIYHDKYWKSSGAENLPANLQTPYFDVYIRNERVAKHALDQSGGDPAKFMQLSSTYFQNLAKNPNGAPYAKAWANRDAKNLAIATGSAPPEDVAPAAAANQAATERYPIVIPGNSPEQYHVLTDAEVKARGLDVNQQYQLNTKTGQITGLGQKAGSDDVLATYGIDSGESGPAVLAKLPPTLAAQVKALAEGRRAPPSSTALARQGAGAAYWNKVLQLTYQYDPSYDDSSFPARKAAITAFTGTGKGAMLVGSINRVANHMDLLWNESKKLAGPNTGFGPLDTALAASGQAFERPDAKAYDTEVTFVAGELGKLAKAGVTTEGEVDRIISNLSRTNASKTREAAIQAAVGIIAGAVDPLKDQYNSAFTNGSTRPKIPWVTPKAQEIFGKIGGVDLSLTGQGADSNNPADSLPAGAKVVGTYQGKRVIEVNGKRMVEQ